MTGYPQRAGTMRASLVAIALLGGSQVRAEEDWEPFPTVPVTNDFGGIGLIQTPTARFAPDGQLSFTANNITPYDRYAVTFQAMPWLEATLRYSSIGNRLYSAVEAFSGDQSYKDRGIDIRVRLMSEGPILPAVAIGARDAVGTGIFQSEYIVGSKMIGPLDVSLGIGWGLLGTRGDIPNPLRLFSSRFRNRVAFSGFGGTLNNYYFRGDRVALFGGVRYDTPIKGLTALVEYDPNNYQSEPLGNQFRASSPINVALSYQLRPWVQLAASWERGNSLGLRLTMSTSLNQKPVFAKIDAPAPPMRPANEPEVAPVDRPLPSDLPFPAALPSTSALGVALEGALAGQGTVLVAAELRGGDATLFVAQTRFADAAQGLGRLSRAAFSVLPPSYLSIQVVFIEGGVRTTSVNVYRHLLEKAVNKRSGSFDELWVKTDFSPPPSLPEKNELSYRGYRLDAPPRFFYGLRPALRTTLGRPEQFILYQAGIKLNLALEMNPGMLISGSLEFNISDNFNQITNGSDSLLQHVRSDIGEYLRDGRASIAFLQADYVFNISESFYGHVYGGLLEEMFGGVGGEVLWSPSDANWALGADLSWVKQRSFKGRFGFQKYATVTGFITASYHFPGPSITTTVRAGRYLARDVGATFDISRRFRSGATVGAFATFTNVSAAQFGEGSFDKGIYVTIPLDLLFNRHVRDGVGLLWRPLTRDGGQQLVIRRPLFGVTTPTSLDSFRRDWSNIGN